MYRIKNTADDRTKVLLHRTAAKFETEPSLGGVRIRIGSHINITDEHYARVKPTVDEWVAKGMVEVRKLGTDEVDTRNLGDSGMELDENGLQRGGPTFEEWTAAGYPKENYPPKGYAEVFSPGLVAYRRAQETSKEDAKKVADVIKEATTTLPSVTEQILPPVPVGTTVYDPALTPPVSSPSSSAPSFVSQSPKKADKSGKPR